MKIRRAVLFALPWLGISLTLTAADTDSTERCLNLNRVDSMQVLDNQRLLFEVSGNMTYLNTLPHACPGMRKNSTIMYRTSLSQLCDLDIITVLDQVGGGFFPGASCGLGKFVPVDKDEVKMLKRLVKEAD